jgi:hypothetical protein
LLNVESDRFFLVVSFWVFFVIGVVVVGVTLVKGSLCCYTFANQKSYNQRTWEE